MRSICAVSLVVVLSTAGCHQFGPGMVQRGRLNYNAIINKTSNEQLLLNLVRLRYRDTPFFMEVGSVTTSFQYTGTLQGKGSPNALWPTDLIPTLGYAEKPTISYSPIQGGKFAKQLLTPLSLDDLILMYHSGWSVERVFLCCVQMMNGVKNAPGASGPMPKYAPEYEQFHEVVKIMRKLQMNNDLHFGLVPGKEKAGLAMRVSPGAWDTEDGLKLAKILGIDPGRDSYPLTTDGNDRDSKSIGINTRSLLGVFFFLSQSVEVPSADEFAGKVTVTTTKDGMPFDWSKVIGKVMRIQSSGLRPRNAAVRAECRGSWFYIADDDLVSKSTFSLISQLFSLQAGEIKAAVPMLTLP